MSSEFDEILQVFFQETQEHLSMLGKKLQEWDAKNNEELARLPFEDINVLLRAAHSIKGNSATCGLENISMVSHAMEQLFDVVRKRQAVLDTDSVNLLWRASDLLSYFLEKYRDGQDPAPGPALAIYQQLQDMRQKVLKKQEDPGVSERPPLGHQVEPAHLPHEKTPAAQESIPSAKLREHWNNRQRTLQLLFVLDTALFSIDDVLAALGEIGKYHLQDVRGRKGKSGSNADKLFHVNLATNAPEEEVRRTVELAVEKIDSILIDVIQGPNEESFGLFDVLFDDVPEAAAKDLPETFKRPEVWVSPPAPPPPPTPVEFPELEIPDPWGMDHLARPDEKWSQVAEGWDAAAAPSYVQTEHSSPSVVFPEQAVPELYTKYPRALNRKDASVDAFSFRINAQHLDLLVAHSNDFVLAQKQLKFVLDSELQHNPALPLVAQALQELHDKFYTIHHGVLRLRYVPAQTMYRRLQHMVRVANQQRAMRIQVRTLGEDTLVDKMVAEQATEALVQLVRYAIQQGIGTDTERVTSGKTSLPYILLRTFQRGASVVFEVFDDGNGLDKQSIVQKALALQVITPEESRLLTDEQTWQLLFSSRMREYADDTSNLTLVQDTIERLGGQLSIHTQKGRGTKIAMTLPASLPSFEALYLRSGDSWFALPTANVAYMLTPEAKKIVPHHAWARAVSWQNQAIPLTLLSELFPVETDLPIDAADESGVWLVLESGGRRIMVWAQEVQGPDTIVLQNLSHRSTPQTGTFGMTTKEDGQQVHVLEVGDLMDMCGAYMADDLDRASREKPHA